MAAESRGWQLASRVGRLLAALLLVSAFAWLLAVAPFLHRPLPAPLQGGTATGPRRGGAALSQAFSLNGLQVQSEEQAVSACDPTSWNPASAGLCRGRCRTLVEQREPRGGRFGWLQVDEKRISMHSVVLQCSSPRGRGRLVHESLVVDPGTLNVLGGVLGPRAANAPLDFVEGNWRITASKVESAEASIEARELALMRDGWQPADVGHREDFASSGLRVLARGSEICLLSVVDSDGELLAVSACQSKGRG